jgi:hypothetical protein
MLKHDCEIAPDRVVVTNAPRVIGWRRIIVTIAVHVGVEIELACVSTVDKKPGCETGRFDAVDN